jgi:hypothetical protein
MATHVDAVFSLVDREATIEITVYFVYLELPKISPVIDGALVVQGTLLSREYGPVLCVVNYAADDEEDFRHLVTIPPWDMIIQATERETGSALEDESEDHLNFIIPIELTDLIDMGDGQAQVLLYVEKIGAIPYDQMNDAFEVSPASYTVALKWTTRCICHAHDGQNEDDIAREVDITGAEGMNLLDMNLAELSPSAIMDMPTPVNLVVKEVLVTNDFDDLIAAKADGYMNSCELINLETGEAEEDQEHLWKFHVLAKYGPANAGGLEDIQFVKVQKSLGHVPEVKGYTVLHDVDLTDVDDNVRVMRLFCCGIMISFSSFSVFMLLGGEVWTASEVHQDEPS